MKKQIPNFERYYISDDGHVTNVDGKEISQHTMYKGYKFVQLYNGKRVYRFVHRLVAEAFVENPLNLPRVNHKDEDKSNNNASNLEWCTNEYNNSYGTVNERRSISMKRWYSAKKLSALTETNENAKI